MKAFRVKKGTFDYMFELEIPLPVIDEVMDDTIFISLLEPKKAKKFRDWLIKDGWKAKGDLWNNN